MKYSNILIDRTSPKTSHFLDSVVDPIGLPVRTSTGRKGIIKNYISVCNGLTVYYVRIPWRLRLLPQLKGDLTQC